MKTVAQTLVESNGSTRSQAAELEVIYRSAPLGLAVYDRNLRFLRINDAMARFNNLSPAEHLGRRVDEVVPRFGNEIAKSLRQVFATAEPVLNVERHRSAPGEPAIEQEFLASYYPLLGEDGSVSAVCSLVQEVSERKRAEKAV